MLFREEQRFRQPWLWMILLAGGLLTLWAARTASAWVALAAFVPVLWLFYTLKLEVEVDQTDIRIRFFPLSRRAIPLTSIQSCEARTYRPIREYGGWGIKYGFSGMAYNVSGDRGVQLVLRNGRRILIGSQRADELAAVINDWRQRA
jgi:hypothetical protein